MEDAPPLLPRRLAVMTAACLVVAALSLLAPHAPTYDPWAWLIWGRDIAGGDLNTVAGPSWKPLPVVFTSAFSLLDSGWAPDLWLVVARTAGLLSFVLAFRVGRRLGGAAAGVLAVLALALLNGFLTGSARGNSESLLVALWLLGIEWHLGGRHRGAFAAGAISALLRPEVWPFVGLYGLWLLRRGALRWGVAIAAGVAVALLWFVPEYVGSGSLLRGASRALEPVPGSPATEAFPFLAVFSNSLDALPAPVWVAALLGTVEAAVARRRTTLALAALTLAYVTIVAVLAQIGFTGNLRYVTLPAALACVVAAAGAVAVARLVHRRSGRAAAVAAVVVAAAASAPFLVDAVDSRIDQLRRGQQEAAAARALPAAVERAGGRDALLACTKVFTGPFETQVVAWHLRIHSSTVGISPRPPGSVLIRDGHELTVDPGFSHVVDADRWTIRSTCALGEG